MCAMSTISKAPTSSAIARKRAKSMLARIGGAAGNDQLAAGARAPGARPRRSRCGWSSRRTPYCTALNHLPDTLACAPCVRWPPAASSMPRTVSPGCSSARYTAPIGLGARVRLHVGVGRAEQLPWRGRSPGSRRRRRTRSRRSSACRDSLRRICWSAPSPGLPARLARRSSPTRSARSGLAGGASSPAMPAATAVSDSARVVRKNAVCDMVSPM